MTLRAHESYGQHGLTPVDRLGVWLSQRAIRRHLPSRNDLEVLELGCGYRATQLIALEPKLKRGIGVDFQIAPELQTLEKFTFHQGTIEQTLPNLESETVDVVMLISVLEHLAEPQFVIQSAWRLLRRSGLLLVNVPTWSGKAIPGVVRIPAGIQSESRDRRSQNVLRQTRSLAHAGSRRLQAKSDPIAVSQVRFESLCSCQEGRRRPSVTSETGHSLD